MRYVTQITERMLKLFVSASRWLLKQILGYNSWDSGSLPPLPRVVTVPPWSPASVTPPPAPDALLLTILHILLLSYHPACPWQSCKGLYVPLLRTLPVPPPFLNGWSGGIETCGVHQGRRPSGKKGGRQLYHFTSLVWVLLPVSSGPSCLVSPIPTVQQIEILFSFHWKKKSDCGMEDSNG